MLFYTLQSKEKMQAGYMKSNRDRLGRQGKGKGRVEGGTFEIG